MALVAKLKVQRRWILWRFETRDDERTKVPYDRANERIELAPALGWKFDVLLAHALESTPDQDGTSMGETLRERDELRLISCVRVSNAVATSRNACRFACLIDRTEKRIENLKNLLPP